MIYDDLEPLLIDMMKNGATINLMSLINTVKQCDDVESVITNEGWYITKENINTLREHRCSYKSGYLHVRFATDPYFEVYNNTNFSVIFKEPNSRGSINIWFTRTDVISTKERHNRNNKLIKAQDLIIDWNKDEVYLISVNGHKVDVRSILSDDELKI